ncbi:flagellar protein FliT, partial [Thioalkalivibrio denitrificans]
MLAQALTHVEAAVGHARKDDWEQVAVLDGQCRALVEVLTSNGSERDPAELADGLSIIRERYRELLALAEAHRDRLAESVRSSVQGRAG